MDRGQRHRPLLCSPCVERPTSRVVNGGRAGQESHPHQGAGELPGLARKPVRANRLRMEGRGDETHTIKNAELPSKSGLSGAILWAVRSQPAALGLLCGMRG